MFTAGLEPKISERNLGFLVNDPLDAKKGLIRVDRDSSVMNTEGWGPKKKDKKHAAIQFIV